MLAPGLLAWGFQFPPLDRDGNLSRVGEMELVKGGAEKQDSSPQEPAL